MKPRFILLLCLTGLALGTAAQQKDSKRAPAFTGYQNNRAPLRPNPYIELPLGAIKPQGWIKEMLLRQKSGATGQLDALYPLVMGARNGWLGGDGDQWERGPYWIDGLLPLAYILNDQQLIAKARPWVEWALNSQDAEGYFGPKTDYGPEPGVQRNNSRDWWPKMVMLKILKQYYAATGDKRVITLMTNYFKYQLKELPQKPLDHWTFWARYRGADNLQVVYWLYNITGDAFLLELGELLHKQTFNYTEAFLHTNMLARAGSIHCVNLAQGMKAPLIYYQHHPEAKYIEATNKGLADLRKFNGLAHGLYGGDEALHGNNPTQGSEFCSAVEMMFSLESMLPITGSVAYADQLEKIAFNALPTQATDDFLYRQYFQQANQVMITRHIRNFDQNHGATDLCFGLLSGYPCCTANMHQGWPKYTQNLWYATPDRGLAALVYGPSEVTARVGTGTEVRFREETDYPFRDKIRFVFSTAKKSRPVAFPFHLRIPAWCRQATILINGQAQQTAPGNQVVKINRQWKSGDVVELLLPMHIFRNTWQENSLSVERGPLVYALKIGEKWEEVKNEKDPAVYGKTYLQVLPTTPWNYALVGVQEDRLAEAFKVVEQHTGSSYPWNPEHAPIQIQTTGRRIPSWQLYNEMAGPLPYRMTNGLVAEKEEPIVLIPYGCTSLRISQFPVTGRR